MLEWDVEGADLVTVSVDGPGIYGTYPAHSSAEFPFSCGDLPSNSFAKHSYTLAVGETADVRRTLTATAQVN